jgi:phospholipid transport system substrate-binding protein
MKNIKRPDLSVSFKYVVALTVALTAVIVTSPVFSQQLEASLAPEALVRAISTDVTEAVKKDPAIQAGDPRKIAALAETKVVPFFDFRRMTMSAMARNWRNATPAQQEDVTREFRTLLVNTYSKALANYRDQAVDFRHPRANNAASGPGAEVTVRSEIRQSGQAPTIVDYDLEWTQAGWRIFDVKVGGVSLVAAYRDSFADEVRNNGVDGLIATLAAKNRQNEARFRPTSS